VLNTGAGPTDEIRVCAAAPRARLSIVGPHCRAVASLPSGERDTAAFGFRIARHAGGRRTPIRFVARGPEIATQRATARLIVRR